MKTKFLIICAFLTSSLSVAQEIYLRCEVSGEETLDTLKKKNVAKRNISVLIKDTPNEIVFNITGMPRGPIYIRGLKKYDSESNGLSQGRSYTNSFSATTTKNNGVSLITQTIDINRLDGSISFEDSITIIQTLNTNGFQMNGQCKLSQQKQQF